MISRRITSVLRQRLAESPAVALLGPRQVGKTTLALALAAEMPSLYLDLESEADQAKLQEPELFLGEHLDRLVILDEVHRAPGLFPVLRGLIDRARRAGKHNGSYLLLGSASPELLRQSGETLAGRISHLELAPLDAEEVDDWQRLWRRGGFPDSYAAASELQSLRWRRDFIRSYLERDIPNLGFRVPAERMRRLWTMLAHLQGSLINQAQLARNLEVDAKTISHYLDLLVDLFLLRRLPPWHSNTGKRLVKSPKIYLRDAGLLHALLHIQDGQQLLAHPIVGASWEGFIIEQILDWMPEGSETAFYRSAAGAEIDLVLRLPNGELWALEIKRSIKPRVSKGFYQACEDIDADHRLVIHAGTDAFPLAEGVRAVPVAALPRMLGA
ncbi:ATP-binding protein [Acidithiobacillus sp. IBUN Pt1247-S3]|uniref:ATP-binding protein n=1 Tax=Acidithiobacillus sp. IBUN Pt1247-S3 TaxID=3166642 RepID=UPI0034E45EBF